jgi:hypothetical protein
MGPGRSRRDVTRLFRLLRAPRQQSHYAALGDSYRRNGRSEEGLTDAGHGAKGNARDAGGPTVRDLPGPCAKRCMGTGQSVQLRGPTQAGKDTELPNVDPVGDGGLEIGDVGDPFELVGRYVGQLAIVRRRRPRFSKPQPDPSPYRARPDSFRLYFAFCASRTFAMSVFMSIACSSSTARISSINLRVV